MLLLSEGRPVIVWPLPGRPKDTLSCPFGRDTLLLCEPEGRNVPDGCRPEAVGAEGLEGDEGREAGVGREGEEGRAADL